MLGYETRGELLACDELVLGDSLPLHCQFLGTAIKFCHDTVKDSRAIIARSVDGSTVLISAGRMSGGGYLDEGNAPKGCEHLSIGRI